MADLAEASEGARVSPARIAEALGIRQASVAQMEKRSNMIISPWRSYVLTKGGKLRRAESFPRQLLGSREG